MNKFILTILSLLFLISCNSKTDSSTSTNTSIYDPKIPGTNVSSSSVIKSVYNVSICPDANNVNCSANTTVYNQLTLKWQIPSLYQSENWTAVLFKSKVTGANIISSITNPPKELGVFSFEMGRGHGIEFVDTDVEQDTEYYYWIYLVIGGKEVIGDTSGYWSSSPRFLVKTISESTSATLPTGENFWKSVKFSTMASAPTNNLYDRSRLKSGLQSVGNPKGRIAIANNGAALFVSDTDNNRILVFENEQMKGCQEFINDDLQYYACTIQASGQIASAVNILGQPDETVTLSCQQHESNCMNFTNESDCGLKRNGIPSFCSWNSSNNTCHVKANQCLTKPTELLVNNNNLFVSDSGNNRVLEYKNIYYTPQGIASTELIGCDPDILSSVIKPTKCSADKVFGKSSINDLTTYSTQFYGTSSLSNPTGLAIDDADLYIADTGNNRIVKVANYNDDNKYLCNTDTWLSSLCKWNGLLGQPSYTSNMTFKNMYIADSSILGGTFSNQLLENISSILQPNGSKYFEGLSQDILKRYFANPTKIQFVTHNNNKYLFIAANEDFETITNIGTKIALKGRVLRFDANPLLNPTTGCNEATFATGKCDASDVIGQETFTKTIILNGISGGSGLYTNTSYGIEAIDDIAFLGNTVIAIDGTNNFVYEWANIFNKDLAGYPYNSKVLNPNGAYLGNNVSLPNLTAISGIAYDSANAKLFVVDGNGSKIYVLDFSSTYNQ